MTLIEVDAGAAGIEHLTEKFSEIRAAFVIDECLLNQLRLVAAFQNPQRHVDVLAKSHRGKSARRPKNPPRKSHVETPRMKFARLLARAAYAAGADNRCHCITNRLLHRRKIGHCRIGAVFVQLTAYGMGFLKAAWNTHVLGKKEDTTGFVKNFYK